MNNYLSNLFTQIQAENPNFKLRTDDLPYNQKADAIISGFKDKSSQYIPSKRSEINFEAISKLFFYHLESRSDLGFFYDHIDMSAINKLLGKTPFGVFDDVGRLTEAFIQRMKDQNNIYVISKGGFVVFSLYPIFTSAAPDKKNLFALDWLNKDLGIKTANFLVEVPDEEVEYFSSLAYLKRV